MYLFIHIYIYINFDADANGVRIFRAQERTLKKFKILLDKKLAEVVESVQPKDSLIQKLNQDRDEQG